MTPLAAEKTARPSADFHHGDLRISENRRFLVHADGTPFFYLGDTAWELFHRLSREDAARYLENRREKRFTVVQAVVLAELDGLDTPNFYGHRPLDPLLQPPYDPARPQEAYFSHVDWIVDKAREMGLVIGMLPTWGDKVRKQWGKGPVVFHEGNARAYGRWLGARYKDRVNLIWILGGDRNPDGFERLWREMAAGLKEGDSGRHLMTYHPMGSHSSSEWLHHETWLDFNMMQSGHSERNKANYAMIERDYNLRPVKPTIDGEPRYEDHPVNWKPDQNGWFDEYDVRQAAYWGVFAGGFGITYGCHPVWQMKTAAREAVGMARHNWDEVLDLPGASQMQHLRALIESRHFLSRIPDQSLIASDPGSGEDHVRATRGDGYAFLYLPTGKPVAVHLGAVSAGRIKASWYDPRTGRSTPIGTFPASGTKRFTPPGTPGRGNDWVLVLDDAGRK